MDVFYVIVKSFGKKTKIVDVSGDVFKVEVGEKPEAGKANLELIKFFSNYFDSEVRLISGATRKKKMFKLNKERFI